MIVDGVVKVGGNGHPAADADADADADDADAAICDSNGQAKGGSLRRLGVRGRFRPGESIPLWGDIG